MNQLSRFLCLISSLTNNDKFVFDTWNRNTIAGTVSCIEGMERRGNGDQNTDCHEYDDDVK